ncbi:MAG: ankyrin repeat domain-containing protein, partial [Parachlamydiaceae bacterium]
IGNYITPPRVLNLPSDPITVVLSKLPLADLSRVAQLNRHGQLLVNRQIMERARRYGYEGKDFEESKNYLKDLKREFNNFLRAQFNSSLSLDEKIEILFQKDASELLDLLRLVAGHSSALLQLFTIVLKEKFKNNPAQDINKKDAYGSGLLFLITCNRAISCSDRFTASHLERRKKLVSLLLKYGADPLDRNINNYTAFHYAAINRETELLRLFLQSGTPIESPSTGTPIESPSIWQHTALAHAAYYGHVETVKLLLEHKASPNIANVNRTTSLHTTVYSPFGRLEIMELIYSLAI